VAEKMTLKQMNPEKILIRSTNWIGDAVMTTPAVHTIRENFPKAEITMLAMPWVADIFRLSPDVDKVLVYDKKDL
jgi:heptosyltransferase-2